MMNSRRLISEDYNISCEKLALSLLGKLLTRKLADNTILKGRIVETECYLGGEDKASHSFNGKRTARTEPMFMPPGTSYVYLTYGMYHCFNISAQEPGAVVLIRALEPIGCIDTITELRNAKTKKKLLKLTDLCNGPSKLCMAFDINIENCNKLDLNTSDDLWIEDEPLGIQDVIVVSTRIGIGPTAEEWVTKPLRYYVYGSKHVSKRDKHAERYVK